jgi:hypothetical protein
MQLPLRRVQSGQDVKLESPDTQIPAGELRVAAKAYDGSARARALTPGQRMGRKAHSDALSLR